MIPLKDCKNCGLCNTRKRIISSSGPIPADVLFIVDAINGTDELLNRPHSGPDRGVLNNILEEAGAIAGTGELAVHIVPVTLCRAHTEGVDRPASRSEVLNCMQNVMHIATACAPKLVILMGDAAKTYYGNEFEEAVSVSPSWFLRKHPTFWINAVSSIADGLRKCL